MGAWSTRIFDNDMTADILAEYKTLLGYGILPEEAYNKVYEYFAKDFIEQDDEDDFWLGIALFQWKNGILLDEVKENALRCIDNEEYLERWKDSGEKIYQKRKNVLSEFKEKLLHEVNPTKKKFPKPPTYLREKTDWKVGDLIAYKITEKPIEKETDDEYIKKVCATQNKLFHKYFLLRVIDIYKYPVSNICPELDYYSEPLVMLYDWYGENMPANDLCRKIKFRTIFHSIGRNYYDELGNIMDEPILSQLVISGVYLSKEPNNRDVCEAVVLENNPMFEIPELWNLHPVASSFCPSQFNDKLAETYTDFGYEERFMKNS